MEIFAKILAILCAWYYHGFGDPSESQSGDITIAVGDQNWKSLCTMNYPCVLYLRNTSVDPGLAQEIQFTFNNTTAVGGRIAYDKTLVLDRAIGNLYVKRGDAAAPVLVGVNFATASLKHSSQNI